jgi:peptidoglycan/LPS O-acetylase OafA/YrhL
VKAPEKIHSITFLRFLAALWVVYHHYGPNDVSGIWLDLKQEGPVAVSFFFVLSGFVLQHRYGYGRIGSWKSFFLKRIRRIHPNYILAFIATLCYFLFIEKARPIFLSVLLQSVALHAWVPDWSNSLNYPSWSISVEYFFYLLFPWLTGWFQRFGKRFQVAALLLYLVSAALFITYNLHWYRGPEYAINRFFLFNPLLHLNAFLIGMLAHHWYAHGHRSRISSSWMTVVAITAIFSVVLTENAIRPHIHNGLIGPLFALLIIGVADLKGVLQKGLSLKPLRFLGDISYGVYLWQAPVAFWLLGFGSNLSFAALVVILISWSSLMYLLVEKRFKPSVLQ